MIILCYGKYLLVKDYIRADNNFLYLEYIRADFVCLCFEIYVCLYIYLSMDKFKSR